MAVEDHFIYEPPQTPLCIVHMDDDLLVLSKPSGLLSVPGRREDCRDSLQSRVVALFPEALLVHRLDMETSGLFIMARNKAAQRHLGLQFERRKTEKTYIARVWGQVEGERGQVDLPLRCDWDHRPLQMVCFEDGRGAQTAWEVLSRDDISTRLKLTPHTGRTHQLRVHMLELNKERDQVGGGHPILGDDFYAHEDAHKAAPRLQLHAEKLSLYHPRDGARVCFVDVCAF